MAKTVSNVLLARSGWRVFAAMLGTIPVALVFAAALALTLPVPVSVGLKIGYYAVFPIWLLAACCTFVAESARQVWASLICLAALAALLSCSVLVLEHGLGRASARGAQLLAQQIQ